jgi:hypothetical protein
MTVSLLHKFHSAQADDPDATLIRPSNWNDQHGLTGDPNTFLIFDGSGNAADQPVNNISLQTPTTGFSITIGNTVTSLVLDPAGLLASGTVTLPATPGVAHIDIRSTQPISQFTLAPNSGQTLKWNPGTLAANSALSLIFNSGNSTWYVG